MAAKNDVVIKLVLVFFVSLLSFAIGTFVGKKYSDNQHKLSMMEPGAHDKHQREVASEHDETEVKSSTVTDDDIAKIAAEFADEENAERDPASKEASGHGAATKDAAHAATDATATAKDAAHTAATATKDAAAAAKDAAHSAATAAKDAAHAAPSKAAEIASGLKEPEKAKEAKKTADTQLPKDVAHYAVGKYTLQIASMATEDEAKKRAETLKSKGYGAFYVPATVKGQTRFRVNVGLFATEDEAKTYKTSFVEKNSDAKDSIVQKLAN